MANTLTDFLVAIFKKAKTYGGEGLLWSVSKPFFFLLCEQLIAIWTLTVSNVTAIESNQEFNSWFQEVSD